MNYQEKAEAMLNYVPALRSQETVRPLSNVTEGEFAVLIYLANEHDGATAGQITTAIRVGCSRTTAILQSLERKGLLHREADPDDGRRVLVYLTEEGKKLEEASRQAAIGDFSGMLEYLGEEDSEHLLQILDKLMAYGQAKEK